MRQTINEMLTTGGLSTSNEMLAMRSIVVLANQRSMLTCMSIGETFLRRMIFWIGGIVIALSLWNHLNEK